MVVVVGIGNAERGDDAVGLLVARALAAKALPGVEVREHGGEVAGLVSILEAAQAAILVDAAVAGARPGSVQRLDAAAESLPAEWFAFSSHGLGLAEAVELARALGVLPGRCLVYAIEAEGFEPGAALSAGPAAAVPAVVERIVRELSERPAEEAPDHA